VAYGALTALDERPRPGNEPAITPEAKARLVSLACDKAKDHGYPHEAEVLCVYHEVEVLKKAPAKSKRRGKPVAIVSYDEKPGILAIATTPPDLPPEPGVHAIFARDHEYKRHGTLSLLAGIDLLTGKVHALVRDRHRSREFIEFLKLLDTASQASTAIKLILDNHSAHISTETRAWLDTRPASRFDLTFTPKHGSWLNLIEGFFSKFTRSVLRHSRVTAARFRSRSTPIYYDSPSTAHLTGLQAPAMLSVHAPLDHIATAVVSV
jgi:transposase